MTAENSAKEKIKIQELGDLLTDCSSSAVRAGFGPFFLGLVAIPLTLRQLNKLVIINNEYKSGLSVFGAVGLAIYTMTIVRQNCERKVMAKYEV